MEFIYTNTKHEELGYLSNASIDIDIGAYHAAKNDFEITMSTIDRDPEFNKGSLFYAVGYEYGGLVERIKVDTSNDRITLKGPTFRGLLKKEYVQPPAGQSHLALNGNAKICIESMLKGFGSLYVVDDTDININNYKVRDLNLLETIERALASANAKLNIKYWNEKVHLVIESIKDLSHLIQYDNNYEVNMIVETKEEPYDHILALGKGELLDRLRLNLYWNDGIWNETPKLNNLYSRTYKYENVNADTLEKLKEEAIDKVPKGTDTLSISFNADDADLFDVVGAKEIITGTSFKQPITQKILKGNVDNLKITYKVGD